jgi:LmbE family N-acetylglucosaminyl deacetylase
MRRTLWAERLHKFHLRYCIAERRHAGGQDCTAGPAEASKLRPLPWAGSPVVDVATVKDTSTRAHATRVPRATVRGLRPRAQGGTPIAP